MKKSYLNKIELEINRESNGMYFEKWLGKIEKVAL